MTNTANQMTVTLKDHMGSDLSVVNAARVSFAKESEPEWREVLASECGAGPTPAVDLYGSGHYYYSGEKIPVLKERDRKLIQYLGKHNHWTPFGHTSVTLHVKAPIYIARQLAKHQVGLVWNEVSRRYVDDAPEFYAPEAWRKRPEDGIKQGSSDETIPRDDVKLAQFMEDDFSGFIQWDSSYEELMYGLQGYYETLLKAGVAPEMARMVLPQSMMTEWYWTGSIAAFARVYKLRSEATAQREVQEIASQIDALISPHFPVSWAALTQQ